MLTGKGCKHNRVAFSVDVDWAKEELIEYTLNLLSSYNVNATVFCTHHSRLCKSLEKNNNCEMAIHPNFNNVFFNKKTSIDKELDDLLGLYPDAIGVRSHGLFSSSLLLEKFSAKGLLYESNIFIPYKRGLEVFKLWNNIYRIPLNWEDDVHFLYGNSFDNPMIDITTEDLYVLDFHPIHVFLNTCSKEHYLSFKDHYMDVDYLKKNINKKLPGVKDCLVNFLETVRINKLKTYKMSELIKL